MEPKSLSVVRSVIKRRSGPFIDEHAVDDEGFERWGNFLNVSSRAEFVLGLRSDWAHTNQREK
jgi:hypothetical protein